MFLQPARNCFTNLSHFRTLCRVTTFWWGRTFQTPRMILFKQPMIAWLFRDEFLEPPPKKKRIEKNHEHLVDNLELWTTIFKWMFGETTIVHVMIWNHPIETTITNWLFGVPGISYFIISKWVSKGKSLLRNESYQIIILTLSFLIMLNVYSYSSCLLLLAPALLLICHQRGKICQENPLSGRIQKSHVALPRLIWPFLCLSFSVKEGRPSHKHVWPTKNRTVSRSNCCNSWV